MIYFDNAATGGEKPDNVLCAVEGAIRFCANPGRSGHKLSVACAEQVFLARKELSEYFDGYGEERVVFTKNCTEALNIATFGCLKKGDHVLTCALEHNSVLRPLEEGKKFGISYTVCPLNESGNIDPDLFLSFVQPSTKMVVLTSASNVTGAIPPLVEIKKRLPPSVLLCVDGAQGGGHIPLPMKEYGIDLLALAGHKGLYGIQGSGALLFSERVSPRPILFGGTGSESFSLAMPEFYPDRLEAGTLNYPAIVSLLEGIRYLKINGEKNAKTLCFYTDYLLKKLASLRSFTVYSRPNPCGIVSFAHARMQSEELAFLLSEKHGIAVRGGLHCAPLAHTALKTAENGLVRVSFSPFNRLWEIDELYTALTTYD